jgi:hypothetical protein
MSKPFHGEQPLLTEDGELRPDYDIDYSKTVRNPYAGKMRRTGVVRLDPDVAEVFQTPESVNKALRAFIEAMPKPSDETAKAA